jgi:sugar lactone lactonase YvrE
MKRSSCEIFLRPETNELRFLPEGPYATPDGRLSWVSIQHGAEAQFGSLNLFTPSSGVSQSITMPGRPGFAFPTNVPGVFICGVEHSLGLIDTATGDWTEFATDIDSAVSNTIINDGMIYDGNLIFGCKDLEFATPKAGLYLWRTTDRQLIQLKDDQVCSNGKAVIKQGDNLSFYDIDSPLKTITVSDLDIATGRIGPAQVVLDFTSEEVFPDGMILTPDHRSLIVAVYNPNDADFGEARQYGLTDGQLEAVWECPGAPQVTCPQLLQTDSGIKLVLTTAIEHLPPERLALQPNAGCLFIGDTDFDSIGDQPAFSTLGLT